MAYPDFGYSTEKCPELSLPGSLIKIVLRKKNNFVFKFAFRHTPHSKTFCIPFQLHTAQGAAENSIQCSIKLLLSSPTAAHTEYMF